MIRSRRPATTAFETLERRQMLSTSTIDSIAKATNLTADRIWQSLDVLPETENRQLAFNASSYQAFQLNGTRMKAKLAAAPIEDLSFGIGSAANTLEISIPTPEGTLARFNIVNSSIMAPELAAQFPQIQTYAGVGVDDPAANIRLDFTPHGFHAQVISSDGGSYMVDPIFHLDPGMYASYYRNTALPVAGNENVDFECLFKDDDDHDSGSGPMSGPEDGPDAVSTGTQLRTYRTAVGATGEYTTFHGGTVTLGQAAIVTAINRVTQVYELDMTVRLQLVANNSSIVYTNSATDPYTNGNPSSLLTQNQTTCDSVIGNANYDVGHVFSTGGGGLAALGVVGITGNKARGETGLPSPIGDAFYIDFVAHELGHQFNALHTFNTAFDTGNRSASAAYEPGSGSTIMAYAGLEGSDDLQNNSDPYMLWYSIQQVVQFVDNSIPGVGTRTATGNLVPSISAGAAYTIPANTPFMATATGSDGNGDTLTYNWEQRDLGAATTLSSADNGTSPLFRSWTATTNPTRMFPRLSSILAGSVNTSAPAGGSNFSERMMTVNRTLKLTVTARDNRAGGGGVNMSDVNYTVVNTGAGFSITNFNSFSTVPGGSAQTINWNVAGTTANGINTANVVISMSLDGGNTFPITLAASTANDGSETVNMPFDTSSSQVRFRVQGAGNIFFDINNANLTLTNVSSIPVPSQPALAPGYDTGVPGDNITKYDNSSLAQALQFTVGNTVAGVTVNVYADGFLIGSALATGSTTTVTTNGTIALLQDGHVITAKNQQGANPPGAASTPLNISIDSIAPNLLLNGIYQFETSPHKISYAFSENVSWSMSNTTLSTTLLPSTPVSATLTYLPGNIATFNYSGVLADGNYHADFDGSTVSDVAGNTLTDVGTDFWFLNGDATRDRSVNSADFNILATNFGTTGKTFSTGNFSFDVAGAVDSADFNILATNFGGSLPPPAGARGGSSSGGSSGLFGGTGIGDDDADLPPLV